MMRKTRFLPSCGAAVDTVPSKCPVRLWMKGPMMDVIPNPTPKQEPEPGRVGVFIDGGCLDHLNGNLALHTPRRKLSLAGLADYAERALGRGTRAPTPSPVPPPKAGMGEGRGRGAGM